MSLEWWCYPLSRSGDHRQLPDSAAMKLEKALTSNTTHVLLDAAEGGGDHSADVNLQNMTYTTFHHGLGHHW